MEKLIPWSLATLVSAFVGSYLASYLRKKGENLATHEDLEKLVEQMKAVTLATKEIEASISDKAWNRQKHWELKRDAVYSVMQALGKADEVLHLASVTIVEERKAHDPNRFREAKLEAWDKFYTAIDDFDQKRALALIVCGRMMNDTLMTLKQELRNLGRKHCSRFRKGICQPLGRSWESLGKTAAINRQTRRILTVTTPDNSVTSQEFPQAHCDI